MSVNEMTIKSKKYGTWTHDPINNVLFTTEGLVCAIDLDECKTSAQVLDWIFHYTGRLTPLQRSDMLLAIRAIIDPCKNLCSWGVERQS